MDWSFNIGWVFLGIVLLAIGGLIVFYHQKLADTWLSGPSSYDRVKLVGVITAVVGLIIMANLHTLILSWIVNLIFRR